MCEGAVKVRRQAQRPRVGIQGARGRFGMAMLGIRTGSCEGHVHDAEVATELRPAKIVSRGPAEAPTHILSGGTGAGSLLGPSGASIPNSVSHASGSGCGQSLKLRATHDPRRQPVLPHLGDSPRLGTC